MRMVSKDVYRCSCTRKKGDTGPFIFDMGLVFGKIGQSCSQREDIDPSRIGITVVERGRGRRLKSDVYTINCSTV
ncbi:hypothetical protein C5167_025235 [Papaver somniferum]|uniref:Uncharacterized protein n=1 Tax=Papaver somniferum TaxID=3469 RepID=A0A4Y7JQU5_PAPSO|nr:hypothetical protein C5167_025235 [Papaver somniferum]